METAIEWLANKINSDFENNDFLINYINEISQAKEMEKQQIIDAYDLGMGHYGDANCMEDAKQYYNQTFKK